MIVPYSRFLEFRIERYLAAGRRAQVERPSSDAIPLVTTEATAGIPDEVLGHEPSPVRLT
ncbi:MAG TPA: hypothetical protein VMZ90_12600 [Vicinamibacterales bacterium]|nr:hypothetical protein [Vicinamibacterales bacterium]